MSRSVSKVTLRGTALERRQNWLKIDEDIAESEKKEPVFGHRGGVCPARLQWAGANTVSRFGCNAACSRFRADEKNWPKIGEGAKNVA